MLFISMRTLRRCSTTGHHPDSQHSSRVAFTSRLLTSQCNAYTQAYIHAYFLFHALLTRMLLHTLFLCEEYAYFSYSPKMLRHTVFQSPSRKLFCLTFSALASIPFRNALAISRISVCSASFSKLPISNAVRLKVSNVANFSASPKLQSRLSRDFTLEISSEPALYYAVFHADSENV